MAIENDLLLAIHQEERRSSDRSAGVDIRPLQQRFGADFARASTLLLEKGDLDREAPVGTVRLSDMGRARAGELLGE